ncbi:hypothetical protein IVB15_00070 [Bradyrhizobium sp. 182]|nr:hypothetical protein [Bradyrhizobium sp. 182]MCK1526202.1 hypothetical protein [Bradyrhizobium sp. 182]
MNQPYRAARRWRQYALVKRSVKIWRPYKTALQQKRRAFTWSWTIRR